MDNKRVALAFVEAINAHDVQAILALMTDDHRFIDAYGGSQGRAEMERGWPDYFRWFPDYHIEVTDVMESGNEVGLFGFAGGAWHGDAGENRVNRWRLPAAWRVVTEADRIKVWQVYCDSKIPYDIITQNS